MKTAKKIIFSDYDGTLDTSEEDITKNIEAIKKFREEGNLFVIATGRSYLDLKRKLDVYPFPFDYLILNHGGVILDKNENKIEVCNIPKKATSAILDSIKNDSGVNRVILFEALKSDILEVSERITKIMLEMKNESSARNLSKKINEEFNLFVKSYVISTKKYYLVEVISVETDKGKAIEKILTIENIDDQDVYPIGDGINDVEMIQKYHGYGMTKSEDVIYENTNKLCDTVADLIYQIEKVQEMRLY